MSFPDFETTMTSLRTFPLAFLLLNGLLLGCATPVDGGDDDGFGGDNGAGTGGSSAGGTSGGTGGRASGGAFGTGGLSNTGGSASGGAGSGGSSSGGSGSGGTASGGTNSGGSSSGGTSSGGSSSGGTSSGGSSSGGTSSGGSGSGGSGGSSGNCISAQYNNATANFNTLAAVCVTIDLGGHTLSGWEVYRSGGRTITVNGQSVNSGGSLPGISPVTRVFAAVSVSTTALAW